MPYGHVFWAFVNWYQTVAGNVALALQLIIMCSLGSLLAENVLKLENMRAADRGVDPVNPLPVEIDLSKLVEVLEKTLKRQLALIRTLAVLNQCFEVGILSVLHPQIATRLVALNGANHPHASAAYLDDVVASEWLQEHKVCRPHISHRS